MEAAENVPQATQYLPLLVHLIHKCITFYACGEDDILK